MFGGKWFRQFIPHSPFGDFRPREMRDLIFMWAIKQEPDGLTGYSLHRLTGIPLTNIYRILENLLKKEYLGASEQIIDGRAQKLYTITKKGEERLNELQSEWADKVSFLQRIVPECNLH